MKQIALMGLMAVVVAGGLYSCNGGADTSGDGGPGSDTNGNGSEDTSNTGGADASKVGDAGLDATTGGDEYHTDGGGLDDGCLGLYDGSGEDAEVDGGNTEQDATTGGDEYHTDGGGLDDGCLAPYDGSGEDVEVDGGTEDGGADGGSTDTGIVVQCGPSPTGKGGEMCDVPAGPFMMGCIYITDPDCMIFEIPYHQVTVQMFKIDKYEVTAAEYKACVTAGGCTPAGTTSACNYGMLGMESHPINCTGWAQAEAYCKWAGKRLPSESEWEKAARGTDGRKYPWGNDSLDCDHAVDSLSPCSNVGTAPVGSKPLGVSPYGAEDMIGNVWEWVEDWWHADYTGAPTDGSAWVSPAGSLRVVRGGSWGNYVEVSLRAANRYREDPSVSDGYRGFRCAMSAP